MWFVAPMREAEERSHVSPAAKGDYLRLFAVHRYGVTPLFYLSALPFTVQLIDVLTSTVYLPK